METESGIRLRGQSLGASFSSGGFWDFIVERQAIWVKKTVLEEPEPWTEDPILQKFFFCNVFRHNDKGTNWYVDAVALHDRKHVDAFRRILWKTITYRLVNNTEIFEQVGLPPREGWRDMIRRMKEKNLVLHSQAYLLLPRPGNLHNRIDRLEYVLGQLELGFEGLAFGIQEAKTLEEVSHLLKQQYGLGPFLSLQIYRDLILAGQLPFTDDDWVEIGPGAKFTLLMLYGPQARFVKRQREIIVCLSEEQRTAIESRQPASKWFYTRANGQDFQSRLTAGDIEHCLCEYGKYAKLVAGQGRRRYYRR